MKPQQLVGIVSGAAVLGCLLGWLTLPIFESNESSVEREVSLHLERARRILDQANADLARMSWLVDQLRERDAAVADPAAFAEAVGEDYKELHEAMWTAFEPRDWDPEQPRPVRPSYGNVAAKVREGLKTRDEIVGRNNKLLASASAAVAEALAVARGDAAGRASAEANRFQAVIFYHQGLASRLSASMSREVAAGIRRELRRVGRIASEQVSSLTLLADSEMDAKIATVVANRDQAGSELQKLEGELTKLDAETAGLDRRHQDALRRTEAARVAMEKLEQAGVDFSDPRGAETFSQKLLQQTRTFVEAGREAHLLEAGGYPKAKIDASGDYLKGRYVENGLTSDLTVQLGLSHLRVERTVLAGKVERAKQAVENLATDIQRLQGVRGEYEQAQADARKVIEQAKPSAADAFDELNRIESEAFALEESALKAFDQAANLSQQAARLADQWMSAGRDRTENLSPEAKQRSAFDKRTQDAWMGGHISVQVADAKLARARVFFDRYLAGKRTAEALASLPAEITPPEADAEAEVTKVGEAREAGVEEIKQAVATLEKSHKTLASHWTLTAEAAAAMDLLSSFGLKEFRADALEAYRKAVKGRETEPFVDKLAQRIRELEAKSQ
ncbi:MAG: hypothetical protein AABZ12_08920 [Planctomycetota bacterium]